MPALDGVVEKLEAGRKGRRRRLRARRLDGDDGEGRSRNRPSPGSTTTRARSRPRGRGPTEAGVGDRAGSRSRRRPSSPGGGYDLVTMFDCLHDMGDPVGAARHVREALAPDGTWMIVEPFAGDRVEDNLNPVGRSTTGSRRCCACQRRCRRRSAWRSAPRPARRGSARWSRAAASRRFRRAAETPFNLVFEARP